MSHFKKSVCISVVNAIKYIFIDYEKEEMIDMAIAQNKLVAKAEKEYEYLTGDEATRRWQELREKAERDEISAYDTGKSDGEKIRN